jgi:hypothetical protein
MRLDDSLQDPSKATKYVCRKRISIAFWPAMVYLPMLEMCFLIQLTLDHLNVNNIASLLLLK